MNPADYKDIPVSTAILSGASTSSPVQLSDNTLLAFISPAAWTLAALNIEISMDGYIDSNGTFQGTWITSSINSAGSAFGTYASVTASAYYTLNPFDYCAAKWIRFRSGTAGTPVNQGADRTFLAILRKIA